MIDEKVKAIKNTNFMRYYYVYTNVSRKYIFVNVNGSGQIQDNIFLNNTF